MEKINRTQWFKTQCLAQGICADDLFVLGDYATNKNGDFIYALYCLDSEDVMKYVPACDVIDLDKTYNESLAKLLKTVRQGFYDLNPLLNLNSLSCTSWDMTQVFRECIYRNKMMTPQSLEGLRKKPVYGIISSSIELDALKGQFHGLCDEMSFMEGRVIVPEIVNENKGYRFALKLVGLESFLEQFACIKEEKQLGPFQILADLEKIVARSWQEKRMVYLRYGIYMYDKPKPKYSQELYYESVMFHFSHFEIEDELDDNFRTIYACYTVDYIS